LGRLTSREWRGLPDTFTGRSFFPEFFFPIVSGSRERREWRGGGAKGGEKEGDARVLCDRRRGGRSTGLGLQAVLTWCTQRPSLLGLRTSVVPRFRLARVYAITLTHLLLVPSC
jgi:hypothetical protein